MSLNSCPTIHKVTTPGCQAAAKLMGLLTPRPSQRSMLLDPFNFTSITLRSTAATVPQPAAVALADDEFAKLLANFQDVTMPSFSNPSPKHGVELFIPTNGPPLHARVRQLPPDKL